MQAITLNRHGGSEAIEVRQLPPPQCPVDGVLVRVAAASLNHLDLFVRHGWSGLRVNFPHVMGSDAAGTIMAIGKQAKRHLAKGLRLDSKVVLNSAVSCGVCEFCRRQEGALCVNLSIFGEQRPGTYAQLIAVPPDQLLPLPKHMSLIQGGAFGLTFVTAWRMLVSLARLQAGEHLLIQGIGGGVATAALLLAKKLGAIVWVSSRDPKKLAIAKSLGADHVLVNNESLAATIRQKTKKRGVDVVLDSVGKSTWEQSLISLRRGGRLVTCGATSGAMAVTDINRLFWNQLTMHGSTMGSRQEFLAMHRFVCRHKIIPQIDRVFSAEQANAAFAHLESQQQMGKIVLTF